MMRVGRGDAIDDAEGVPSGSAGGDSRRGDLGVAIVAAVVLAAAALRPLLEDVLDRPAVGHWATLFVAVFVQALPFLVLGVGISAAIAAFVPPSSGLT